MKYTRARFIALPVFFLLINTGSVADIKKDKKDGSTEVTGQLRVGRFLFFLRNTTGVTPWMEVSAVFEYIMIYF